MVKAAPGAQDMAPPFNSQPADQEEVRITYHRQSATTLHQCDSNVALVQGLRRNRGKKKLDKRRPHV